MYMISVWFDFCGEPDFRHVGVFCFEVFENAVKFMNDCATQGRTFKFEVVRKEV